MSYEDKICEAISLMVDKAVSEANFDRTIQAIVQECSDASIGKYKVKYQDSTFYAYATSSDVTYTNGSNVYVLVPSNDMTRDKTILGTVTKLGINYVTQAEGDEAYDYVGTNCIKTTGVYQLSSYAEHNTPNAGYVKTIYGPNINDGSIIIDGTSLNEYIKKSSKLICGGFFRTSFPDEQKYQGNYGIIFELEFDDNTENRVATRYYIVDVDNMTGDPYNLKLGKRQYGIFDIDGANFRQIKSISIFTKDFPHRDNKKANLFDINISDIEFYGANQMTEEEINGCGISFYTPDGSFFTANSTDASTLRITAQVKMKGKLVDAKAQKIPFYWFMEDVSITPKSEKYNKYGGRGWRCLNTYNVIEAATATTAAQVEWIPYGDTWTLKCADAVSKENKFKCAIVYDGVVYKKEIIIKNMYKGNLVTIESDLGTKFYYDIGRPVLTCKVDGQLLEDWIYSWAVEDPYGNLTNLPLDDVQNSNDYNGYLLAKDALDKLQADLAAGKRFPNEAAAELATKQANVDAYKYIQRIKLKNKNINNVYGNQIYSVAVNEITNFVKYKCSAFDSSGKYRGTGTILLTNTLDTEDIYTLVINNGTQSYKYSEFGVSPASKATDNPIEISELTFSIFDNLGQPIEEDILRHCDIKWKIPIANTMLKDIKTDGAPGAPDPTQTYQYYTKAMTVSYQIENKYYYDRKNNTIELTVNYKGMSLTAKTNLTFIKEGESGTNGTDYTCKIVPNSTSSKLPVYPTFTIVNGARQGTFNFKAKDGDTNFVSIGESSSVIPFVVKLYKAGEEVFSSNTSGNATVVGESVPVTVTWSMLSNKYNNSYSDSSNFKVDGITGRMNFISGGGDSPCNILKVAVTYGSAKSSIGNTYTVYATLPIILATVANNNYQINLNSDSGFRYALYTSDGTTPKYDSANPFEIKVTEKINNIDEDVSIQKSGSDTHGMTSYDFNFVGRQYNFSSKTYILSNQLIKQPRDAKWKINQQGYKPITNYDGMCVTNAVICSAKRGSIEIAKIHIPIHFLLNKYGLAELNDWDGNSIDINNEGGFILAPEIGAGRKETDNTFTGVLMGEVQMPDRTTSDIGLLGFNKGKRSFLVDAEYGHAIFGQDGNGRIAIDPTQSKALIYSGNFWKEYTEKGLPRSYTYRTSSTGSSGVPNYKPSGNCNGQGLLIDLTNAEIFAGSGNFYVDGDNGYLHARGGGDIGGWKLDDYQIYSNDKQTGMNSVYDKTKTGYKEVTAPLPGGDEAKAAAFWAGGSNKTPKFYVTHDGYLRCNDATIGSGSNKIYIGKSGNDSALYTSGKGTLTTNHNGFYLGVNGFSLGATHGITYKGNEKTVSKFQVDNDGTFYAKGGYIGSSSNGWTVTDSYLHNGGKTTYNDGTHSGVYLGTNGIGLGEADSNGVVPFYVSSSGNLHAKKGTIANWTISNNSIRTSSSDWGGTDGDSSLTGMYFGTNGINLNGKFSVSSGGRLYATSGKVGGWTLSTSKLTGGNMEINSAGSIKGGSTYAWSITTNGDATFNWIKAVKGTIGGINISKDTFTGLSAGTTTAGGTTTGFKLSSGGKLTASDADITGTIRAKSLEISGDTKCSGIKLYTDSTHYIYFGTGGNKHPTLSGLNLGSGGIKTNDGKSGQTYKDGVAGTADITFVSSIDSVVLQALKNNITISFKTRKLRFYDGICTNCSNATGRSVSDS